MPDLSLGQQTLWWLYRFAPDSAAYNDADAVLVAPGLDPAALRDAVSALVARHGQLGSTFVDRDGRPWRVPGPPARPPLVVREVPGTGDDALHELVRRAAVEPLALETEGPCRFTLFRRENDGVLLLVNHHLASDAISQGIVWRDLMAAYTAALTGTEPDWPPLSATYDDYLARETALVTGPGADAHAAYWRGIADGAATLALPTDRPRPASQGLRGAARHRTVPGEPVRVAAAAAGVTPFAVLTGTFQALLHRYTGEPDFLIGCPVSVRRTRALREVVGFLVNTTLLRARFTQDTTFADAMRAAQRSLTASLPHAAYPFALYNDRRPGGEPLYRVAITMVGAAPRTEQTFLHHRVRPVPVPHLAGQCDLNAQVMPAPGGALELTLRYDVDLFDAATVDRLAEHFLLLLDTACTSPDTPVARAALTTSAELDALLAYGM
ncbi:hypothetical protein BLA60_36880 [Actinophytocola xinjiangensis]|uniref:Condensation domain-containing protein n=1 Tax=Actinophytocola xinjiangensis TaxID=485602 RepID=A0A7Z1AUL4_9PSEU|nr:condensation domain-containing protein [Actinophytocola xinjiangensis]OLF05236.1 hypothetical protein BLA60_36880 [Actinophytocola xinjiangensis]